MTQTNYDILKEYEEHQTPVPTYKEWEKLNWYAGNGVEENQELKMENKKLKELLDEAFVYVHQDCLKNLRVGYTPVSCFLVRDIKEVLKDYRRKNAIEFIYVKEKKND